MDIPSVQGGNHYPGVNQRHEGLILAFPSVGIPTPGKTYNNTKVAAKDLPKFDQELMELFKAYNVKIK